MKKLIMALGVFVCTGNITSVQGASGADTARQAIASETMERASFLLLLENAVASQSKENIKSLLITDSLAALERSNPNLLKKVIAVLYPPQEPQEDVLSAYWGLGGKDPEI